MKSALNKILAITPARGGSKGVPRKNIRDLCGKPLIAYSIQAALKSNLIDRVVVSTEDQEIAEISESFGAAVPFLRPKEMAQDRSSIGDAITFTINELRDTGYDPDILVTFYPTHLFRPPGLVDFLVNKAIDGYSPVNTVRSLTHTNLSIFSRNGGSHISPLLDFNSSDGNRIRKTFFRNYGLFLGPTTGPQINHTYMWSRTQSALSILTPCPIFFSRKRSLKRVCLIFDLCQTNDSHNPHFFPK